MRIVIKTDPYSVKHLQALMLQKDLTRKAVAVEMNLSQVTIGRALDLSHSRLRERVIRFIEGMRR